MYWPGSWESLVWSMQFSNHSGWSMESSNHTSIHIAWLTNSAFMSASILPNTGCLQLLEIALANCGDGKTLHSVSCWPSRLPAAHMLHKRTQRLRIPGHPAITRRQSLNSRSSHLLALAAGLSMHEQRGKFLLTHLRVGLVAL